jgi:hypothetical protein
VFALCKLNFDQIRCCFCCLLCAAHLQGKRCFVSGSGNVAQYAAEKLIQLGAVVLTLSDSTGYVYEKDGFTMEQVHQVRLRVCWVCRVLCGLQLLGLAVETSCCLTRRACGRLGLDVTDAPLGRGWQRCSYMQESAWQLRFTPNAHKPVVYHYCC